MCPHTCKRCVQSVQGAKVTKALPLLCPGLRRGSDFPHSGIAPWAAAMGHPWPGAANPASMPGCPLRNTYARPATSRNLCRPYVLRRYPESKAGCESGRSSVGEICRADLLCFAFSAAISQTTQNARREAEWRCRGVGRSAWMPSERRWAMDGPSARARPTVPERGYRREAGAVRQRRGFGYFWHQK
ncbi:Uncharacterised protein [Paucimonas lemoignei]|nr:Uncharacterised protein [Paucimonas lemoignei]